MKKKGYILFLDSGLGGLSTLFCAREIMQNENFFYLADFLNSPYGNKTKKNIEEIVLKNIEEISSKFNIKCIVLACNTATAACAENLRKKLNVRVVGAEPAILPAFRMGCKKILVLSTSSTKKYNKLLKEYKNDERLLLFCPKKLASLIDTNLFDKEKINTYLNRTIKKLNGKIDGIVLGCTHYVLIKEEIKNIFGGIRTFDGNLAIAKRIFNVLTEFQKSKVGEVKLFSTDQKKQKFLEKAYKKFCLKEEGKGCAD